MPSISFSTLRNALRGRIQNSVVGGKEGGLQDSVVVLIGQGELWFGNSRLFHSVPLPSLTELQQVILRPGTVSAIRPDSQVVNQQKKLSVVGALSRTLSIPSVSGPSFQVCGYHIDRALTNTCQFSGTSKLQDTPMAALGSRAVLGERRLENFTSRREHHSLSANNAGIVYGNRGYESCRKVGMSLKNQGQSNNGSVYGYYVYKAAKGRFHYSPDTGLESREFHNLPDCSSTGTASDVSFDNSTHEEQLVNSAISSEEKISAGKTLKLLSGSCYLPHPDKEETGGEDAHFICVDEQAIGVADGVGGWADLGIDAGEYSRELMSNVVSAIQEEPKGSIDLVRVLEKAHKSTRARGSSTACIIALTGEGLHAINLGDSGFMVVRDGCTVFRSPVQQHDFNFTYQLESGNNGDLPSSGQVFTIPIAPGDVIISGTDGLFDNLYNNEITAVVVHALRAGFGPQVTAQKIAALARQRAQDKNRQTPFSTAAQEAGFRYYGGKLDDITVVVSYIARSDEESESASSRSSSS